MVSGITLVRDHHEHLKNSGATVWDMPKYMSDTLDGLAGI
jgi:hypothetical protein